MSASIRPSTTDAGRDRILREHATAKARFLAETLPIIRVLHSTDRMISATDEARRLVQKGYRVTMHIGAEHSYLEIRGQAR